MVTISVNNNKINVESDTILLKACLDNDIYIPNLCYIDGMAHPPVSCRLCFVDIDGEDAPVLACSVKVKDGMTVHTDTDRVRQLQQSALRLLLSAHDVDCVNCAANRNCALQDMVKFLKVGLKSKKLRLYLKEPEVVDNHPCLFYLPNRCVLCGRCVYVCQQNHKHTYITFAKRGFDTIISFSGDENAVFDICNACHECVDICPVKAIQLK